MMQSAPSESSRLFIALWPNQVTRAALHICRERWTWPKHAHLAHTDSLHITLHFLGNIAQSAIPALMDALCIPFSPFDLTLNQQQVWSNGVAALAPEAIPPQLSKLHDDLSNALQSLAISVEARRYRPHVTFARHADHALYPQDCTPIHWRVDAYALMQSRLTPPRGYHVLQTYRCDGS